jgi:hypothetical protein
MAAMVAHAMVAVPACTSGPRTSSTVRSSLRCFTAVVRGQSLQQQQRGQARSQRVAAQARAPRPGYNTPPADEEEQREEEVRMVQQASNCRPAELHRL